MKELKDQCQALQNTINGLMDDFEKQHDRKLKLLPSITKVGKMEIELSFAISSNHPIMATLQTSPTLEV
jgi:hypothetical protein